MNKKALLLQTVGAVLQVSAAFLLVVGGGESAPAAVLGGLAFGIGGLVLWGAGAAVRGQQSRELANTLDRGSHLDERLLELRKDVNRLHEDRAFYKALYAQGPAEMREVRGSAEER